MRIPRLWPVLTGMLLCAGWVNGFAQTTQGSVTLQWTAPGDDSLTGNATRYDLRYSLFPINESNFQFCSGPGGLPRPAAPGSIQRFTVFGLLPGLRYYIALKTADERLNWSKLSNVIAFAQPAVTVDAGDYPLMFASPIPNPARNATGFAFSLPQRSRLRVDILDVQGRLVQRVTNGERSAGPGVVEWDLRDVEGRSVAAGVYLARAELGSEVIVHRILVVR